MFFSFLLILITVGLASLVLLILGVRKLLKLKSRNKRFSKTSALQSKEDNKVYKDFTDGHLYDSY